MCRPRQGRDALKDYVAPRAKEVPLGRIGGPGVANIACFLASDAGSYVTGPAIDVRRRTLAVV